VAIAKCKTYQKRNKFQIVSNKQNSDAWLLL